MLNKRCKIPSVLLIFVSFSILFLGCASYKEQQKNLEPTLSINNKVNHTFFIAGGMGNVTETPADELYQKLQSELKSAGSKSTVIFTGDNISEKLGNWEADKSLMDKHLNITSEFLGNTVFIPGNNEWKAYNSKKVEKIEDYIKDKDNDRLSFFPENACPIEHKVINDDLDLILIDSKWFIANWSRIENINKKCTDIVTRRRFMEELEGYINDGQGKNIVIAMHHPVFSNGVYAGNQTIGDHLKPIPVYGTLKEAVMDLGSFNPDHLNSRRYNYLRILVTALAQSSERVTVVSGHEENLQYLYGGGIHQLISGSLGSKSPTHISKERITAIGGTLEYEGKYTYGARGFVKLEYFDDGSSKATFYNEDDTEGKVQINLLPKLEKDTTIKKYDKIEKKTVKDVVLDDPKAYEKSGFYKFLWGERYRKYFGESVTAPVAYLDTLHGGLKVVKEGGGHQSFSLRLEDEKGRQYSMRSLRKNALKFLKFKLPGIAYNQDDYQDTWAEKVISDFFTTAHPYMQLTINPLARAAGVNHSDNDLFYIPKQDALEEYNENFGDELYFVERRPSEEQANYKGYRRTINESGKVTDYESTTDMLEKIKSDESYTVDQKNFIRARIFDMLIGDWDRHQDQWRWIEYEGRDGEKEFMPIPRDRDNVFPKFDGFAMGLIKLFVPNSRMWQTFDEDINNVKWQNMGGQKLDRALLNSHGTQVWVDEAKVIQKNLTTAVIEKAFQRLPAEVRDETIEEIKENLKKRLQMLDEAAEQYAEYLNRIVTITGTEKDDLFEVERRPDGITEVVVKRLLSDEKNEIIYQRVFNKDETKEIWLYGLGDDDEFNIGGNGDNEIKIRIVGGYGEDEFNIKNKKRLKVYEWNHEETIFNDQVPSKQISDIYKTNSFHWRYFKPNMNILVPNIGFRQDDGLFLGLSDTYTINGINGNSFRQRHQLAANYYFGFQATEVKYKGVFGNIFPSWNFEIDGYYTSDRFAKNFFGFGNETVNEENQLTRDFYRARLRQLKASVGLAYYSLRFRGLVESFRLNENDQRLFNTDNFSPEIFENQTFLGAELTGDYDRTNADDFPTKAIYFGFAAGYKYNLNTDNNKFGYASLRVGFDYKLIPSGDLVLGSTAKVMTNIGNNEFFFYHAPSIGGDNGLRGFRDERFSGKSYFFQSTDLKLRLKRYITAVSPVTIGIYGGFDYGRVWVENDNSNVWHISQGGGFWISSLKALKFQIGYFNSRETNLLQVGLGIPF